MLAASWASEWSDAGGFVRGAHAGVFTCCSAELVRLPALVRVTSERSSFESAGPRADEIRADAPTGQITVAVSAPSRNRQPLSEECSAGGLR